MDTTPWRYEDVTENLVRPWISSRNTQENASFILKCNPPGYPLPALKISCQCIFADNRFCLPTNSGSATTHIIKPVSPAFLGSEK